MFIYSSRTAFRLILLAYLTSAIQVNADDVVANSSVEGSSKKTEIDVVEVIGHAVGELGLKQESSTGSRLGLTVLETPATVEVIDDEVMRARGYQKLSEAVESFPGVITGNQPTAPSAFSMRGFSGSQITVLRDGLWIGPSTMVMRPQNTFNLQSVEILRGPSSVVNGVGAVAGTVNAITKTARENDSDEINLLASYGEYNSQHYGVGAKGSFSDSVWYNATVSSYGSDGYVDRTDESSLNFTGSLLWKVTDDISAKLTTDHLKDDVGSYFGTPLVPLSAAREPLTDVISTTRGETLDEAMRFKNYNIDDAKAESSQYFNRLDLTWNLSDSISLQNTTYQFNADRHWKNAEGYVYCTQVVSVCSQVGTIQRYNGYFLLDHDQELFGDRFTFNAKSEIGGMENRFVAGVEAINMDFVRTRGFRQKLLVQPSDAVDPYNPIPGVYGTEELRGASPTKVDTRAIFAEDALQLTSALSLVAALRYDTLDLDRKNFRANGTEEANGFARQYNWTSWRLGSVYKLTNDSVVYGQYSTAKDPVGSNILLVNANQNFDLTSATQWEIGIKSSWLNNRAETTIAYYNIERDDVLERIALDSATSIGGRDSSGVEASITLQPTEHWRLGANTAYTDANFKPSSNFVVFAGNTPPNVAKWTANTWISYDRIASLPLEAGISLHYVGDRFGDNQNSVTLKSYALTDIFAAWKFKNYRLSAKIDNVFDEIYAPWSEPSYLHQDAVSYIYSNELSIGAPRTYRISLEATF